jgi:hypothetical protein
LREPSPLVSAAGQASYGKRGAGLSQLSCLWSKWYPVGDAKGQSRRGKEVHCSNGFTVIAQNSRPYSQWRTFRTSIRRSTSNSIKSITAEVRRGESAGLNRFAGERDPKAVSFRCLSLHASGTPALRKTASELSRPAFAAASGVMSLVRPKTSTLSASL